MTIDGRRAKRTTSSRRRGTRDDEGRRGPAAHSLTDGDRQDLDLREVISEVRRLTVVDRRAASGGVAAAHICVEEYIKALDEDRLGSSGGFWALWPDVRALCQWGGTDA